MYYIIITIHIFCAIGLIITVLLQAGKGGGLAGGMAADTVETAFGAETPNVLKKATSTMAIIFMVTSLSLAFVSARRSTSLMKSLKDTNQQNTQTSQSPQQTQAKPSTETTSTVTNSGSNVETKKEIVKDPKTGLTTVVQETTQVIEDKTQPVPVASQSQSETIKKISEIAELETSATQAP